MVWAVGSPGFAGPAWGPGVTVVLDSGDVVGPRVEYGLHRLREAWISAGARVVSAGTALGTNPVVRVRLERRKVGASVAESFAVRVRPGGWVVEAGDETGFLYGCLGLAEEVRRKGGGPVEDRVERPALKLRGVCVGLQKPTILPGRQVYEYPWTPELFPWFYDRAMWREFLDVLAECRYNTLYLWNGHPFGSVVRVPEYPEGVEVPEPVLQRNMDMMHWLARECDRRGIWLVVMFYNILLPQPLAEKHGLPTQLSRPHPVAADYTRRAIATFIREYPHVGLLVCLGEALQGAEHQLDWATNVILPGVMEGARAAGLKELPPLIIRTHATYAERVLPPCFALYTNLYTMTKFNGESLTTDRVRGRLQELHRRMAAMGPHVVNVHILANLEPFRYFAPGFIRRCVQGMREDLGAAGLHLYPLAYWNWPDAPDRVEPPLRQWERDRGWFEAWGRYAWDPDRPEEGERVHWRERVQEWFGCGATTADRFVEACDEAGLVAPILLRRFGITEGNRQTLSLGMTLEQLVHPERFQPVRDLWECLAPPGWRLQEYVARSAAGEPCPGETPARAREEALARAERAVALLEGAEADVRRNREEFRRWQNDLRCLAAMARFYEARTRAAEEVLRYRRDGDAVRLDRAAAALAESVTAFEELTRLAGPAYRFANSLQTGHRRIPFPGVVAGVVTNYHWSHVLPLYRAELATFQGRLEQWRQGRLQGREPPPRPWRAASVRVWSDWAETYEVVPGAQPFRDRGYRLVELAPELHGLTGIRFSHEEAKNGRYRPVEFEVEEAVYVLLGLFRDERDIWLQPPNVDAAAHWAEQGGSEPILRGAARVEQCPLVDVYALRYPAGRHRLEVPGSGSFVVLGVVPASETLRRRDLEDQWP
ncbi:hypothetical protein G4L39_00095 [Limisphaera ngatamarikiensis]|uniref:Beta-hexosaminidase bacterial type N-terminal domain-containing protein n=2 Tax=Limisphaera ngatamarikiensis TaxID=1324935 RepID=A0A6M1RCP5_9BACT|nr:hypothetical protein [Limisphaera ngatamarikiensis]